MNPLALQVSQSMTDDQIFDELSRKIATKSASVGVIGLGYVGLPLAVTVAEAGYPTYGFDIDEEKVVRLNRGDSYIDAVPSKELTNLLSSARFTATSDFGKLAGCDVIMICVPTPLTRNREPDLSFVAATTTVIAKTLRAGQLVILESTTYPGTTTGIVRSILAQTGMRPGADFFVGYSPEREDPGNAHHNTHTIPKVVSGDGARARELVEAMYSQVVRRVVSVSSTEVAEAVKLTENIFRSVNIALVNELKIVFTEMGIDIWEVIEAAKSKPFGFMPFYPGPGLGGHCIPIDPFYLTWAARAVEVPTRFIELAGEINTAMPRYVVERLTAALGERQGKALSRAAILLVGAAYKKNVQDIRESPSLKLIELLEARGAKVDYHDPHVAEIPRTREHSSLLGRRSVPLSDERVAEYDAVVIATDHDAVDYECLARSAKLILDTRNAMQSRHLSTDTVVKA
jgi:UDP-N-acetyl-D-glucosamine dehydrogenase